MTRAVSWKRKVVVKHCGGVAAPAVVYHTVGNNCNSAHMDEVKIGDKKKSGGGKECEATTSGRFQILASNVKERDQCNLGGT